MNAVLRYVRKLVALEDSRQAEDQELVRRFVEQRDEAAFAALVDRHGGLVLSAARRLLRNEKDAEDVFQATFLVFVRKAGSIRRRESVASWLYGVAYRLALKARTRVARQHACEQAAAQEKRPPAPDAITLEEFQRLLDDELQHLPEKYRSPILLCCLEGKSRDEAARQLGWSEGAVKIRLERGRDLLRRRLIRRGVALSTVLSTTLLGTTTHAALPVRLAAATVEAGMQFATGASAAASVPALALANALVRSWVTVKVKVAKAVVLVAVIGLGTGVWAVNKVGRDTPAPSDPPAAVVFHQPAVELPNLQTPLPEPAKPAPGEGPSVTGILQTGRINEASISLRVKEVEMTYALAAAVRVVIDGKDATLADLKSAPRVTLTLSPDGKEVVRIAAEGRKFTAGFLSADLSGNRITVLGKADTREGNEREDSYPVAPDASVTVNGLAATLADLKVGTRVSLQLSLDGKTVIGITCATE